MQWATLSLSVRHASTLVTDQLKQFSLLLRPTPSTPSQRAMAFKPYANFSHIAAWK